MSMRSSIAGHSHTRGFCIAHGCFMQPNIGGHSREQPTNPKIHTSLFMENIPKPKLNAGFSKEEIVAVEWEERAEGGEPGPWEQEQVVLGGLGVTARKQTRGGEWVRVRGGMWEGLRHTAGSQTTILTTEGKAFDVNVEDSMTKGSMRL